MERNTICFYGCWRKWSQPNTSDALTEKGVGSWCGGVACVHQPGACWLPWNGLFAPPKRPAEAGFSSACSNYMDSLVPSVSLWISCGMVQSQGFLWVTKTSFLLCPVSEFDGWTSCSLRFAFLCFVLFYYHCVLQLLVYMRVVEFVCTLISSLLKCVWFNNFLVSLPKLLRPRSFLGWRKFIHCPPPPGWHKSLPPSARPEHSSFD